MIIKASVLIHPAGTSTPKPALRMAAPAYPPIRACDELVGRPICQVIKIPDDGSDQARENNLVVHLVHVDHPGAHGLGNGCPKGEGGNKIEHCSPDNPLQRGQYSRGNHRGDRVGRIMEAVDKIKSQRQNDNDDDQNKIGIKHSR